SRRTVSRERRGLWDDEEEWQRTDRKGAGPPPETIAGALDEGADRRGRRSSHADAPIGGAGLRMGTLDLRPDLHDQRRDRRNVAAGAAEPARHRFLRTRSACTPDTGAAGSISGSIPYLSPRPLDISGEQTAPERLLRTASGL